MHTKETSSTSCFTAECGTKIFAYFNLVLVVTSAAVSLIALMYLLIAGVFLPIAHNQHVEPLIILSSVIFFLTLFVSAKSIVFAALLVCGVQKKKPQYIKAYFVYGVIVAILSLLTVVTCLGSLSEAVEVSGIISALLICVIYCLILAMIRKTYIKYETMNEQFAHARLNEKA